MKWPIFVVLVFLGSLSVYQYGRNDSKGISSSAAQTNSASTLAPVKRITYQSKQVQSVNSEQTSRIETVHKFKNYLENSYVQLPAIKSLRLSKQGEFHTVPPEVIQSSEIFGEIAEKLSSKPYLIPEALKFFRVCATNDLLVTSVRAVCARNMKDWAQRASIDVSQVSLPENIAKIADFLPKMN